MNIKSFFATIRFSAKQRFADGLLAIFSSYIMQIFSLIILVAGWKILGKQQTALTTQQLLTYSLMAMVLWQQFNIITPATAVLWDGTVVGRYTRPMHVFSSFIAETIGKNWIPPAICCFIPVLLLAPLFGVSPLPHSLSSFLWFVPSLALSVSLGFAIDFLFAAIAIHLNYSVWALMSLREKLMGILCGAVIPFSLMPRAIARVLGLSPLASIAAVPLTIYVGADPNPVKNIAIQFGWNVVFWSVAVVAYKKSEERMISYGG